MRDIYQVKYRDGHHEFSVSSVAPAQQLRDWIQTRTGFFYCVRPDNANGNRALSVANRRYSRESLPMLSRFTLFYCHVLLQYNLYLDAPLLRRTSTKEFDFLYDSIGATHYRTGPLNTASLVP